MRSPPYLKYALLLILLSATIRSSITAIRSDLDIMRQPRDREREYTRLDALIQSGGGAYRSSGPDSVFFWLYTGVQLSSIDVEYYDVAVGLAVDTPAHPDARHPNANARFEYWQSSRRLQGGSLVALVIVTDDTLAVYLGVIASRSTDIAESALECAETIHVRVSFFDTEVHRMALQREMSQTGDPHTAYLIDNSVVFEASRPFLEILQTVEPTDIPFAQYIASCDRLDETLLCPPRYALTDGFKFNLNCLAKPGCTIHSLDASSTDAADRARHELKRSSKLDPSQVDAVINTLTREVSLIQGYAYPSFRI